MDKLNITKNLFLVSMVMVLVGLPSFSFAEDEELEWRPRRAETESMALSYTHILPSAFVLPHRTIVLGTTVGVGLFDVVDLSSNLYLDIQQVFNLSAKVAVWSNKNHAVGVHASYFTQSVNVYNLAATPINIKQQTVNSFVPGATYSYRIRPGFIGHAGLSIYVQEPNLQKTNVEKRSGYFHGTTINKEFAYALSKTTILAAGVSYDFAYEIIGLGPSIYLDGFHLGFHFYPNAAEASIIPIVSVGYSANF